MNYSLLTLQEAVTWDRYIDMLPVWLRDIYLSSSFYKLFDGFNGASARCFLFEDGDQIALYPFLLSEVNSVGYELPQTYFDIQAPYGYNGMVTSSANPHFGSTFMRVFRDYCQEQRIVAEMIRFNPVLQNQTNMPDIETSHVLDNVVVDLSCGYEFVWNNSFEKEVRGGIRKSEKYGLSFEYFFSETLPASRLNAFKEIYRSTMNRNNAVTGYYFSDAFFSRLVTELPGNSIFFFLLHNDKPISAELVLLSDEIAYPYLGGTFSEMNYMNPNTFLRHKLLQVLVEKGIKYYSMGGGRSKEDSLFRYKKSFSRNGQTSPIYIGKRIHHEPVYQEVVRQWQVRYPDLSNRYENFVLKYRYHS